MFSYYDIITLFDRETAHILSRTTVFLHYSPKSKKAHQQQRYECYGIFATDALHFHIFSLLEPFTGIMM